MPLAVRPGRTAPHLRLPGPVTVALAALLLVAAPAPGAEAQTDSAPLPGDTLRDEPAPRESGQHLVSVVESPDATTGTLHRFEAVDGGWRRVGSPVRMVVGRSGVGPKREGDGRSPRGVFRLGPAFGYAAVPPDGLRLDYRPMPPGAVCVDDPGSSHYARIVDPSEVARTDWGSAEAMRRDLVHGDDLYRWGVLVEYNPDGTPGAGSCIFLHVWRGPESPTVGCTAMAQGRLLEILTWLRPEREPLLIQGTRAYLERLRERGVLPYPVPGPAGR